MCYIIKKLEKDLYLTDNFLGKGVLTGDKDWTDTIEEAIVFEVKPLMVLKGLDLIVDCRIEKKE